MKSKIIQIALVILIDKQGKAALQLRSPIPNITNPDKWGIFGGHIEEGESPEQAAIREIQEELTCRLDLQKLQYINSFHLSEEKKYFLFRYQVAEELENAILTEGEEFGFFSFAQVELGEIAGKAIVSYHRDLLLEQLSPGNENDLDMQ